MNSQKCAHRGVACYSKAVKNFIFINRDAENCPICDQLAECRIGFPVDLLQIAFVPGQGLVHISQLNAVQRLFHTALLDLHAAAWFLGHSKASKWPTEEAETAYINECVKVRQLAEAQGVTLIWEGLPAIPVPSPEVESVQPDGGSHD